MIKKYRKEFFFSILFFITLITSLFTQIRNQKIKKLEQERKTIADKISQLTELSIKYPYYRDLLYRLSIEQFKLGNLGAAKSAFSQAKYLDPNNEINKQIEVLLKIEN